MRSKAIMFIVFVFIILFHIVGGSPSFSKILPQENRTLLSHDELFTHYQKFWDAFIFPASSAQLQSINSSLFTEDVVGQADMTRRYIGRELNTEYLFGTFSDNSFNPTVKTLMGAPLSHQTIHFATQDNFVTSSELVLFNTSLIGGVIPVEMYIWMLFNERGEVKQYDITFRWYESLFQNIINSIQQQTPLSSQAALSQQLAQEVCQTALDYCTGSNEQYSSCDCQNFLVNEVRFGASHEFGGNTLLCRHLHAKIVPLRPEVHCPHIGTTGGDMCVDDLIYQEVVLESAFRNASGGAYKNLEGNLQPRFLNATENKG